MYKMLNSQFFLNNYLNYVKNKFTFFVLHFDIIFLTYLNFLNSQLQLHISLKTAKIDIISKNQFKNI